MFCSELIIDADHDDKGGWEIVLRLDAESMEASWADLDDTALRIRAHSIGAALVETLIAERNQAGDYASPEDRRCAAAASLIEAGRSTITGRAGITVDNELSKD